jgi:hypothetical protein
MQCLQWIVYTPTPTSATGHELRTRGGHCLEKHIATSTCAGLGDAIHVKHELLEHEHRELSAHPW